MTLHVSINPRVLRWAVERTELTVEDLSQQPCLADLASWVSGASEPTLNEAEALAKAAQIPFGYLLLDEPTEHAIDLPDFRARDGQERPGLSLDLEEVLEESSWRLSWYAEHAVDSPQLLGSAGLKDSPEEAAQSAARRLRWSTEYLHNPRNALDQLADLVEDAGMLVMRSATRQPLSTEEFSGFTLVEDDFVLIFINAAARSTTQLFALAHQLGHVVLGEAGISGDRFGHPVERWCHRFAAELLQTQTQALKDLIDEHSPRPPSGNPADTVGLSHEAEDFRYATRIRLGRRFLQSVVEAARSGALFQRDAARLLGVQQAAAFQELMDFGLEVT